MIVLSNSTELTIQPGQSVPFDEIIMKTLNGAECFRNGGSSVKMCARGGIYRLSFSGNVGGTTAATPVQLQLQVSESNLPETIMISTPAAVGDLNNVAKETYFRTCCCDPDSVSVTNTGTEPVILGIGSSFAVSRVA